MFKKKRKKNPASQLTEDDINRIVEKLHQRENVDTLIARLRQLVHEETREPITAPFVEEFRDMSAIRWNTKVMGGLLAKILYGHPDFLPKIASDNVPFLSYWGATRAEDYTQAWFLDACKKLKRAPVLHRKVWEFVYVLKTLETEDKLKPGMKGVVFGCGEEPLPSYFASCGADILATDLDLSTQQAKGWVSTNQHASNLDKVFQPEYISRTEFDKRVSFRFADMNDIPRDLDEQFDFCWSICAFEHLGSIQKGLDFVRNTMNLLKPGGISVHTTEFNYTQEEKTIDNWGTVLFRRKDFEALKASLQNDGHILPPVSFDIGDTSLDQFIDIPPYPGQNGHYDNELTPLHLKLMVDGFPSTCYGITVRKAA